MLLKQFSRWRLPDEIVTDCGKNFDSKEVSQFCQRKQTKHTKSSPHHHQSNGKAESAVKIVKYILTYIHTYLPTYLPTYLHTYIHTSNFFAQLPRGGSSAIHEYKILSY